MSLSSIIPQFSSLPIFFSQHLILQIQKTTETRQNFISQLNLYQADLGDNKNLPIVKEQFFKNLIKRHSVQQTSINAYQFMTGKSYTIQQKYHVWNLVYKLIYLASQLAMNKQKWKVILGEQVAKLARKFNIQQRKQTNKEASQVYTPPVISTYLAEELNQYMNTDISPFYQIWQKLLDQNQDFTVKSMPYQPVQQQQTRQDLSSGKKLQTSQILDLQILKQYIGQKPPVEEKRDPKKK